MSLAVVQPAEVFTGGKEVTFREVTLALSIEARVTSSTAVTAIMIASLDIEGIEPLMAWFTEEFASVIGLL